MSTSSITQKTVSTPATDLTPDIQTRARSKPAAKNALAGRNIQVNLGPGGNNNAAPIPTAPPQNAPTATAIRQTVVTNVSAKTGQLIFAKLGLDQHKPLTSAQQTDAQNLVTKLDQLRTQQDTRIATVTQKNQQAITKAQAVAAKKGQPFDPSKLSLDEVPARLSDSALFLKSQLMDKLRSTSPSERNAIANALMNPLGLKDNEEITDSQFAKAHQNLVRFENARDTQLFQAFGPLESAQLLSGVIKATANLDPKYQAHVKNLSDEQLCALRCYTEDAHCNEINGPLRRGEQLLPQYQTAVQIAKGALAKLPSYEGWCFRGCSLPLGVDANLQTGAIFRDKAFISSAANTDAAFAGTHQIAIFSSTGRDISFVSSKPEEREVLFPDNHPFQVVGRKGNATYPPGAGPDVKPTDGGEKGNPGWGVVKIVLQEIRPESVR